MADTVLSEIHMIVYLNGEFVPEEKAVVSVFDRSFLYGDGLYETVRIFRGVPFRWEAHFYRLSGAAKFLGLELPLTAKDFFHLIVGLAKANDSSSALVRLTVSRGVGLRGYSPTGATQPFYVGTLHPPPADLREHPLVWKLAIAGLGLDLRVEGRLAQYKTCSKLAQVLARREAEAAGAEEGLMLNTRDEITEGTSSNVFWVDGRSICTPPIEAGLLPGVTRSIVRELCPGLGFEFQQRNITPEYLARTDGVFLSLTSQGIVECGHLGGIELRRSAATQTLFKAYQKLLLRESGSETVKTIEARSY